MKLNSHGFTLIEMMIVVVILAVLLSIATMQFSSWKVKYSIDTQTRELLSDLSDARLGAIQTKGSRAVFFNNATSATFRSYTTNELVSSSTGRLLFVKYYSKNPILTPPLPPGGIPENIIFNSTGLTVDSSGNVLTNNQTIVAQPTGTAAAIDCVVISTTKINVGKYNNGSCVFQ